MREKRRRRALEAAAAVLLALPFLLPLLVLLSHSFLSGWELRQLLAEVGSFAEERFLPLRIPPVEVSLHQYKALLLERPEILRTLLNAAGYTILTLTGMLLVAPPAAFVFAKLRFRGRDALFLGYVVLLLLPFQVMCVPQTLTMDALGLMDSPLALILPEVFSPIHVFLLRQFMRSIPDSLLEAAALDGAGLVRIYATIVLPVSVPALCVCGMLCAAKCWGMIEQPLLFLKTKALFPLSLYMNEMLSAGQPEFLSTCVLAVTPVLLVFLLLNDDIMKGIVQMEL